MPLCDFYGKIEIWIGEFKAATGRMKQSATECSAVDRLLKFKRSFCGQSGERHCDKL